MKITPILLLKVAVAFAFLYPPIAAVFNPSAWIWFVPDFVEMFVSKEFFLHAFGLVEVIIALGILFMKKPIVPLIAASAILFVIVVIDFSTFDIVFRDISILLAALALILMYRQEASGIVKET